MGKCSNSGLYTKDTIIYNVGYKNLFLFIYLFKTCWPFKKLVEESAAHFLAYEH